MLLDTTNLRMEGDHDCGAISLRVVYRFHGLAMPAGYDRLANPARGLSPEAAEAALRAELDGVTSGQGWDISDLVHHLKQRRPVMCLVSVDEAADHWVVVRGHERGRVFYHDPAHGRGSKSIADWLEWWTGPNDNAWKRFGLVAWPTTD